jgi:hypothetical protein
LRTFATLAGFSHQCFSYVFDGIAVALAINMSRAQGGSQALATIESTSAGVSQPNFVDGRIYRDAKEMRQINAAAAAKGYLLVCDRCENVSEPIVAVIAVANPDAAFGFCGDCYRKISEDFLGRVV